MKWLVFSDAHLYQDFDKEKYRFLKKIISHADRVIINGDFWDGYICTFTDFINSPWARLFPILKSKNTIYIYGNHDSKKFSDSRVLLFSNQQMERYTLQFKSITYHIEHGNHYNIAIDRVGRRLSKLSIRSYPNFTKYFKKCSGSFIRICGKPLMNFMYRRLNKELKSKLPEIAENVWFIFGHTHLADVDIKKQFIDTGFIQYGLGQYLILDENGFELKEERYK